MDQEVNDKDLLKENEQMDIFKYDESDWKLRTLNLD